MEMNCEFRYSSWTVATSRSVHYTCWINSAWITDKLKVVKSFKGAHEDGKANDDVEGIVFIETQVEYFPRGLNKIFPRLKKFEIRNCGLKEICREDLIGLEELLTFGLPNNFLTTLPDDLFTNMTSLQVIYFNNNQIEFASSKLFTPFNKNTPRHVNFSSNTSIGKRYISAEKNGMEWSEFMNLIDKSCKRPPSTPDDAVEKLLADFNELRMSNRLTDFVIVIGSKELSVHKNVLAIQSPTFKELFKEEKDAGKLIVSDSDLEAVEGFLDYLYTRKTPSSTESASRILKLAEKYKVEKLKSACEDAILARLDDTNLLEIFNIGHESCLENLIASAFHKIQDMFGGKIKDGFMNQPEAQSRLNALISKVSR